MTSAYTPDVLDELHARVARHLHCWNLGPHTEITLLNVSENATYALRDLETTRECVLRVHRLGYSSAEEIGSELAWINALRRDDVVRTAAPLAGVNGEYVQTLHTPGMPSRHAVAFERLPGKEPSPGTDRLRWFQSLGEINARLHRHVKGWAQPEGFVRKRWDVEAMVGPNAYWGPWRAAIGLDPAKAAVLEQAVVYISRRLERFGSGADRFGLVHADLRLANLLADDIHLQIIDFDDCGFSWYLYDFATAVSFIEHKPEVPLLLEAWLTGYRKMAPLDDEELREIPTFIALRRILLTAWLASHAEIPFARQFGASYTEGTVRLAQQVMNGQFLT